MANRRQINAERRGYGAPVRQASLKGLAAVNVMPRPTKEEHANRVMSNVVKMRQLARNLVGQSGPMEQQKAAEIRSKDVKRHNENQQRFGVGRAQEVKLRRQIKLVDRYAAQLKGR